MEYRDGLARTFSIFSARAERRAEIARRDAGDLCRPIDLRRIREAAAQIMLRSPGQKMRLLVEAEIAGDK